MTEETRTSSPPTVSVVIPTYNRERWLPRSIGSVQQQSFADWELLVVDDGSTDGSWAMLQAMAAEDSRIRPMKNLRTKGVSGARNTGIDAARGEFVAFLDSDDEWYTDHLDQSLECFARASGAADVVCAVAERRLRSTGEVYVEQRTVDPAELATEEQIAVRPLDSKRILDAFVAGGGVVEIQTAVVRREAIGGLRFWEDLRMGEDGFFFAQLAESGAKFYQLLEKHVTLWAHDANTTSAGGRELRPDELIRMYEDLERLGEKMLATFSLSESERRAIRRRMAAGRFWQIGYRGYLLEKQYADARRSFRRAISWDWTNLSYWRTYVSSFVRQGLRL